MKHPQCWRELEEIDFNDGLVACRWSKYLRLGSHSFVYIADRVDYGIWTCLFASLSSQYRSSIKPTKRTVAFPEIAKARRCDAMSIIYYATLPVLQAESNFDVRSLGVEGILDELEYA